MHPKNNEYTAVKHNEIVNDIFVKQFHFVQEVMQTYWDSPGVESAK